MREYGYDEIDGRRVPQLVVTKDHVIVGIHQGTVHVEAGTLYLRGTLQGTLDVQNGASVEVTGEQQGTVTIASGAKVTVIGAIQDTTTIEPRASLIIEASGKVAGTLCNHGLVSYVVFSEALRAELEACALKTMGISNNLSSRTA